MMISLEHHRTSVLSLHIERRNPNKILVTELAQKSIYQKSESELSFYVILRHFAPRNPKDVTLY
jgi:hypothetical protein